MDKTVAALELTSKQIKIVVGYELDGQVFVLYTLCKPISGLIENGRVTNPSALAQQIANIADIYDEHAKLKIKISEVLLILPPCGLEVFQSGRMTTVISDDLKVSTIDINNVYAIIKNGQLPVDNVLIDIVPTSYILDGDKVFPYPPYGEISRNVTIKAKVHTLPPAVSEGYFNAVHTANLRINHAIVGPFASSELISSYQETPVDYFLVDIGSNLTSVSLIGKKQLYGSRTFYLGGDSITRKISEEFNISENDAEQYKILYGIDNREMNFSAPLCTSEDENGNQTKHYSSELTVIIKNELDNFIKSLKASIDEISNGLSPTIKKLPIIFIGGGSQLNGLIKYITPKIDNDVVTSINTKTLGARNPSFFNCLGAIYVHSKYPVTVDDNQPKIGTVSRNTK